jgi:hypothetical protein
MDIHISLGHTRIDYASTRGVGRSALVRPIAAFNPGKNIDIIKRIITVGVKAYRHALKNIESVKTNLVALNGARAQADKAALECWRAMAAITADYIMHEPNGVARFDSGRVVDVYNFWDKFFPSECANVPGIEILQKQMLAVLNNLKEALLDDINEIDTAPSANGQNIITAMGIDPNNTPQAIQQAIIQSLLTPHRQIAFPTCSMDSIISKEAVVNPKNLIDIYKNILIADQDIAIEFPASNDPFDGLCNFFDTMPISSTGVIDVCPQAPESPDNSRFFAPERYELEYWNGIGITPIDKSGFKIQIHDINDVFCAMFMHCVYNINLGDDIVPNLVTTGKAFIAARQQYYGTPGNMGFKFKNAVELKCGHFNSRVLETLIHGISEEDVTTIFSQQNPKMKNDDYAIPLIAIGKETGVFLHGNKGHIENLYPKNIAMLTTGRKKLEPIKILLKDKESIQLTSDSQFQIIGDRNWMRNGEPVYLGIISNGPNMQLVELTKRHDCKRNCWQWQANYVAIDWVCPYAE